MAAFNLWQAAYRKSYRSAGERSRRQAVFVENALYIAEQNVRTDSTLRLALNEFADMTFEEFSRAKLGYNPDLRPKE